MTRAGEWPGRKIDELKRKLSKDKGVVCRRLLWEERGAARELVCQKSEGSLSSK